MKTLAALAIIVAASLPYSANAGVSTYNIGTICKFDIEQYCKNIPRKRIRDLKACLGEHEKDLFPRCQDHYKEAK